MDFNLGNLNWFAIAACIVVGQVFLTVWFLVLFGEPWARAYGVADKQQHAKEIPGYTYGIGLVCVIGLTLGLATLQRSLGINSLAAGIQFGIFIAAFFCIATALPGYAFLRRWSAASMAIGSQATLIVILSLILALWQ